MISYRLVAPRYSKAAFSGEGAYRYGGRWNSPGVRVVYTSSSIALAVLEVLAYRKAMKPLSPRHLFTIDLDDEQVSWLEPHILPEDWNAYPHPESTQQLGDAWANEGKTIALAVPSVLAPREQNIMLSCDHPEFASLPIGGPEDFPFNPRLTPDAV